MQNPGYPQNGQNFPAMPNQGGYPPGQPGYPPGQPGYPPGQPGYPPGQPGYPPGQPGYPPGQPGYPATSPGYQGPPPPGYPTPQPSPIPGYPQGYPTSPVGPPQNYPGVQGQGGYPVPGPTNYPQTQAPYPGQESTNQGMYQGNVNAPPSRPDAVNAPSAADMNRLPGYEGISFDATPSAPPPYNPDMVEEPIGQPQEINLPQLKEDDARESLKAFTSSHCCYGNGPANTMEIIEITPQSSFHYKLETFTEKRETSWEFEPFNGRQGISTGPAPGPWDVSVKFPGSFTSGKVQTEVPNTSDVRPCHDCVGMGRKRCHKCHGNCSVPCDWCKGKGKRLGDDMCDHCAGAGRKCCQSCQGNGNEACKTCKETGKLRYFIRLKVTWAIHIDDKISETSNVPIKYIRKVTGETAFEDQRPRVLPLTNFFDPAVVQASNELITKHLNSFKEERVLEQRHKVQIIPISEISYRWKTVEGSFHIYGFENQVHFPDYPAKCCCGCCSCCVIL